MFAVESGSRAWGFSSPNSDYDIRFIYKHEPSYYLSLWEKPNVIEFMTTNDLDGSGWDIAKALKLLAKSNAPFIEWLFSPVVYYQDETFIQQMQALAIDCFSPIASLHHYLGTTKNFIDVCEAPEVKKKLLLCLANCTRRKMDYRKKQFSASRFFGFAACCTTKHSK